MIRGTAAAHAVVKELDFNLASLVSSPALPLAFVCHRWRQAKIAAMQQKKKIPFYMWHVRA